MAQELFADVSAAVAARLLTIPPPAWTATDVVNWLYAAGQPGLAVAALKDGLNGQLLSHFKLHPKHMVSLNTLSSCTALYPCPSCSLCSSIASLSLTFPAVSPPAFPTALL